MEEWHFCVICLSDLRKLKSGGGSEEGKDRLVSDDRENTKSVKFLIQYLLTTQGQTYNEVLQDILKLIGVASSKTKVKAEEENVQDEAETCSSKTLRMCGDCGLIGGQLQELHQGMEELQRKIKKQVETVNETIIRSSGWLGGINGGEEAFENFSKKFCGGDVSSEVKQTFEILKAFQTAVTEAEHDRERNPELLVRPLPVSKINENSLSRLKEHNVITEELVKAEPSYEDPEENDETGSLHLESFLEDFVGNYASTLDFGGETFSEPDVNNIARKRKIRRISSSSELSVKKANPFNSKADNGEELSPLPCSSKITPVKSHLNRMRRKRKYKQGKADYEKKRLKTSQSRKLKKSPDAHGTEKTGRWGRPLTPPMVKRVAGCFICDICGSKQRYPASFEHHLRGHEMENTKAFQCETCKQEFTTKQFRDFHKDQHKGHHRLCCDICKGLFSSFKLPDHMKTHVETIFPCSQCSHYSSSMENHLLHVDRQHWGKEFKCRICGSMFNKKQHLLLHFHQDHKAVDKIGCDAEGCSKTFWTETALRKHKRLHTDQFSCAICCKRCTSLGNLQTHQRLHSNERPFKCDQCPEGFNLKSGLINHMVSKHGAEKFKCECGKEYSSTEGLLVHKKMEHNASTAHVFYCPVCNKKCVSPYRLQLHMDQHSAEKKYMCEVCGKSFQTSNTCNQHKRIHGEKKFVCPHPNCPKAFTKPGYLEMHIRVHTGEKPFFCELCKKGFSQKGSVNIHRKKCPLLSSNRAGNESKSNIQPL